MYTPYAVKTGDISFGDLSTLSHIQSEIQRLPDAAGLSCHDVCAHLARTIPGLVHRRGWFAAVGVEHSWLVSAENPAVVFDVYPVAGAVPFVVTTAGTLNPWGKLYLEDKRCSPKTQDPPPAPRPASSWSHHA